MHMFRVAHVNVLTAHLHAVRCVAVCGTEVVLNVANSLEMSQKGGLHPVV